MIPYSSRIWAVLLMTAAWVSASAQTTLPPLERAAEQLDTIALRPAEGIWEYAGEELKVLVMRINQPGEEKYSISVLEAFDPELTPGTVLGYLSPTAEKGRYELSHYTRRRKSILDMPGRCVAILAADGTSIKLEAPKSLKIRFNPFTLLPRFWRIVSLSLPSSGKGSSPAEGMRRLYPSGDGRGVWCKSKRYL